MSYIANKKSPVKFLPKLTTMSPYEVYLNQVKSAIDPIRFKSMGMEYLPPQLGGLSGQRKVIDSVMVLQTIDFQVNE
jgi:hypothetical protein